MGAVPTHSTFRPASSMSCFQAAAVMGRALTWMARARSLRSSV